MNKEQLLSEGYLSAYITGETDEAQTKEIAKFIAEDPEALQEYYDLQKTLELLSFYHSIAPSGELKKSLMENPAVMQNIRQGQTGFGNGIKLLMAASVFVTFLSLITAFHFWNEWRSTDEKLTQLTAKNLQLAENYHSVNRELAEIRQDLSILVSPEFSRIILSGTENSPDARAVIYWNSEEKTVFLNSGNLAALPRNQQYQLWALIDGQPIDAGTFDASAGIFQDMNRIAKADAFAVTIEKAGGSKSPTLRSMQVYGKKS